ncbi:glycine C-acetyltransferase [Candidatus Fermentibacteria bacterium]|nr:MAG: glycine C-acetyltransferase [Candidatus Fermentibacteria bacterium]
MSRKIYSDLTDLIKKKKEEGLYKEERIIESPQGTEIEVAGRGKVLNFCANNYLGLASHSEVCKAAENTIRGRGFGMSSVRFICGTLDIHRELERRMSQFLGTDDTILYAACYDANAGIFEPFLGQDSAIIADQLNHASIIEGVRLCKAKRYIYSHNYTGTGRRTFDGKDLPGLEEILKSEEVQNSRYRMVATDGVFSMNGDIAPLKDIVELCEKYDALLMVDDSHGTGYIGATGRGTHELCEVMGRVDIITTTFGKALGGASGGCASGRQELVDWLRQMSRPYLFSNTVAPAVVGATIKVLDLIEGTTEYRDKVHENAKYFREKITEAGFTVLEGDTAIVPIMFGEYENDAVLAQKFAKELLDYGVYAIGFFFPVVALGASRIRVQLSAAHTREQLDRAIDAFVQVGRNNGIID